MGLLRENVRAPRVEVRHALQVGPCLDAYVLSDRRHLPSIRAFLSEFSSSDLDARLEDVELLVLPEDYAGDEDPLGLEDWNSVPVKTLDAAIRYGLADPDRAFRLYLDAAKPWCGALIGFTRSKGIVFGVSVDDPLGEAAALEQARDLVSRLVDLTDARRSWIAMEEPPPLHPDRDEPWLTSLA